VLTKPSDLDERRHHRAGGNLLVQYALEPHKKKNPIFYKLEPMWVMDFAVDDDAGIRRPFRRYPNLGLQSNNIE